MIVTALGAAAPAQAAVSDGHPNDPLFDASPLPNATNEQWDLASPGLGFDRGISVDRAWPLSTGAGITIADDRRRRAARPPRPPGAVRRRPRLLRATTTTRPRTRTTPTARTSPACSAPTADNGDRDRRHRARRAAAAAAHLGQHPPPGRAAGRGDRLRGRPRRQRHLDEPRRRLVQRRAAARGRLRAPQGRRDRGRLRQRVPLPPPPAPGPTTTCWPSAASTPTPRTRRALNGRPGDHRHRLHRPRAVLRLRPAPRRRRADAGARRPTGAAARSRTGRHVGGDTARGGRRGAGRSRRAKQLGLDALAPAR